MYYDPYNSKSTWLDIKVSKLCRMVDLFWARLNHRKAYQLSCCVKYKYGKLHKANLGDDLNVSFLPMIIWGTLLPIQSYSYGRGFSYLKGTPIFFCIGSCLHLINDKNSCIWGSGLLTEDHLPIIMPKRILAVRGPMTRAVLLSHGIECPDIYGDPALLLPYYYQPKEKRRRYKLGIVAHYVDYDKQELDRFKAMQDVAVIKMSGYNNWTEVIDEICSCDFIASSSLHGIIIPYAYGIPSLWVEIREPIIGEERRRFKFYDFFLSQNIELDGPMLLSDDTTIDEIIDNVNSGMAKGNYSIVPLVQACPFKLKTPIKPFE